MKAVTIPAAVLFFLSLLPPILLQAAAPTAAELFHQGNEAYSRGDYEQAISHFETITQNNGFSSQVLYNLAGSYGQAGKTGRAVLNYERALRLAPYDSDTLGNLELIRNENGLFQTDITGTGRFLKRLTHDQWSAGILFFLGLYTLFTVMNRKFAFSRVTTVTTSIFCLVLLLVSLYATVMTYREFNPSVVIEADARLLVSPFDSSASIGAIQEGRLVYPLKEHNNYSYVKDKTGRKGWIRNSLIEPVCKQPGRG